MNSGHSAAARPYLQFLIWSAAAYAITTVIGYRYAQLHHASAVGKLQFFFLMMPLFPLQLKAAQLILSYLGMQMGIATRWAGHVAAWRAELAVVFCFAAYMNAGIIIISMVLL